MKVPVSILGFTVLFIVAIAGQPAAPHFGAREATIQGCLSGKLGALQINDVTSGRAYKVLGQTEQLARQVGKAIRVRGVQAASDQGAPSLEVKEFTQTGECTP